MKFSITGLISQRLILRFWVNFENNCHKWLVLFNRFMHLIGKITQDIIPMVLFILSWWSYLYFLDMIFLFPILFVLMLSHCCCLLENCLCIFVIIYVRLHIISSRTTSCLPHNFSLDVSILGHLFLWLQFAKHSNDRHLQFV